MSTRPHWEQEKFSMQVYSSLSGIPFYAPSAGYAPTNSADVSAIASAYQVVSSTATQLNAGTAYVTSINDTPLSAARAGNAANASLANSAWYDGTGRLISALPDSAAVSSIASSYVESGVSSKQDTLSFAYNTADQISSINGSALGGMDDNAVSAIASAYAESAASGKQDALNFGYDTANAISSIDGSALAGGGEADWSAESGQPGYIENKPVPKMLVAGQGITITENSTGLVVASTNTLYTAGSGLTLNGTTFAVDTATVQGKLTYNYDASGNISGIDGSSLVGGDPEAADLYVQSPLYTGVSGGSAYIGWNNETVLYSDYTGRPTDTGTTISLNESPLNFQYVEVFLNGVSATSNAAGWANSYQKIDTVTLSSVPGLTFVGLLSGNSTWWDVGCAYTGISSTTWTKVLGYTKQVNSTAAGLMDNDDHLNIWKVVGINRTAGE